MNKSMKIFKKVILGKKGYSAVEIEVDIFMYKYI